jgi:hypothetical protein
MATRALRASSNEHVTALNLIDLDFAGSSRGENGVREAWNQYLDHLSRPIEPGRTEEWWKIHNDQGADFLSKLLDKMAKALRYDFTMVQLKRGVYLPTVLQEERNDAAFIRRSIAKVLAGTQHIPMDVKQFPVSEDALKAQIAVQEALLKALSGVTSIRVVVEPPSGGHSSG